MNQIPASESDERLHRLRAVSRRIESFFERQVERLRTALSELQDSRSEYEAARRLSIDLDEQRTTWEREREQELVRLNEASQSLARAWHELEQRQRELETGLLGSRSTPVASPRRQPALAPVGAASASSRETASTQLSGMDLFEMRQLQASVNRHSRRGR